MAHITATEALELLSATPMSICDSLFLTIDDDEQVVASFAIHPVMFETTIDSIPLLKKLAGGRVVMCSSTIDFPEESTSDPDVIALCKAVQ